MTTDLGPSSPNGGAPTAPYDVHRTARPAAPAAPRLVSAGRRRRPAIWALGLALVAGGGAVAAATTMAAGDRVAVLSITRSVDAGAAITAADLGEARVAEDSQLRPIPASQRESVIGQVAGVDLRPGTLLTRSQLTPVAIPATGQALVGLALEPGKLPARRLQRGDRVLAVLTPGDASVSQPTSGQTETDSTRSAVVVSSGSVSSDGSVAVDVVVNEADAAGLAADAAAGRISLVLLPRKE
jgi:SAF domain